jgi:hypothetical protein
MRFLSYTMLARFRLRFCPTTFKKPVCCGLCPHCGHAGLPCASMVIGVCREHQRPNGAGASRCVMSQKYESIFVTDKTWKFMLASPKSWYPMRSRFLKRDWVADSVSEY